MFHRFNYTHYDKNHGAIYKSIEALDKTGMDIIETGDPYAFKQYLLETDNTICGRHPISVFLHVNFLPYFALPFPLCLLRRLFYSLQLIGKWVEYLKVLRNCLDFQVIYNEFLLVVEKLYDRMVLSLS